MYPCSVAEMAKFQDNKSGGRRSIGSKAKDRRKRAVSVQSKARFNYVLVAMLEPAEPLSTTENW